jgi:leucyl/phenylalanyl-tRNA---protein transferase
MPIFQLTEKIAFPPPRFAEKEGLLAVGGDLSPERILLAYKMGIFPWYSEDEPILWWSPDPRLVLYPDELHISQSLKKIIKKQIFHITCDMAFDEVIRSCAALRAEGGTWLNEDMIQAYTQLHRSGLAHSFEAWHEEKLAGGLYGISLGKAFFGESMFSLMSNASKTAFASLVNHLKIHHFNFIDCQVRTRHLMKFGAREIPRTIFLDQLKESLESPTLVGKWSIDCC